MTAPSGTPRPSVSSERLTPRFPRSVGLGPVFPPTQRRFPHRPIQCKPFPVDADQVIIGQQAFTPERLEHAGLSPFLKTPVRRGGRADICLPQRVPLASRPSTKKIASIAAPSG